MVIQVTLLLFKALYGENNLFYLLVNLLLLGKIWIQNISYIRTVHLTHSNNCSKFVHKFNANTI